jgi:hypothetical protein
VVSAWSGFITAGAVVTGIAEAVAILVMLLRRIAPHRTHIDVVRDAVTVEVVRIAGRHCVVAGTSSDRDEQEDAAAHGRTVAR